MVYQEIGQWLVFNWLALFMVGIDQPSRCIIGGVIWNDLLVLGKLCKG